MSWVHITREGGVCCIGAECVICKARNAAALAAAPDSSPDMVQLATSEGARRTLDRLLWSTPGNRPWPEIVGAVRTLQEAYKATNDRLKATEGAHAHKWRNCWDDGKQNTRCELCGISIAQHGRMNGGKCP